jgi:polygalacturonase
MAVNLSPVAGAAAQFLDNSGNVLTGGKLYTYAAGTTTPQASYTSGTGITFHSNPIILDAAGRVPAGGEIWLTDGLQYKFVLTDANDVLIGTWDNLIGINSNFLNFYTQEEIQTATAGQTIFTLSSLTYSPGTNSLSVFVDGVNQYDGSSYAYVETNSTTITFTAGLHVGALVKFTTAVSLSSGVNNASLVTYDPPFTGSETTTVEAKLSETVSVKDFGAVGDGLADDTTAIQAAIDAVATTGQSIYAPAGTYKCTDVLSTTGNLSLYGDGEKTVFDFSDINSASSAITVTGTVTQIENIASANQGNLIVTFASAPSLITGDVFILFDDSVLWNSARPNYYSGEWLECREVYSTVIAATTSPLYDSYTPGTTEVYKLNSPAVSLRNFKIIGGADLFALIKLTFCDKALIENVIAYNENYQVIELDRCYRPMVSNCNMYNKGTGTSDDYGLVVSNGQNVQVTGGNYYARRHGIAIGGSAVTCGVPNRNLKISNLTISNDVLSDVASADIHGNTQDLTYQGCTIYQGATWGGMDNGYDNCVIYAANEGWCVYSSEVKGGELFARNCKFVTLGDPSTANRAIIDVGGNNAAISSDTDETLNIIVQNCYLSAANTTSNTSVVTVVNEGTTQNINIQIDGLVANVNTLNSVLRTANNSGTANSSFIVVDNVANFPSGIKLHNSVDSAYLNKPHRLQKQSGYLTIATTIGTAFTNPATVSYKYVYPRAPVANASIGQTTQTGAAGNYFPQPNFTQVTENGFRPYISVGGNISTETFSANVNYGFNWSVSINEV